MPTYFQNVPVRLAGRTVYASQASFDESISTNKIQSYGVLGSVGIYNEELVKGGASANFYITDSGDISTFTGLIKSSAPQTINIGGYTNTNAYLNSMGVNVAPNSVIEVSTSWTYFGAVTEEAITDLSGNISPAMAQKVIISGYTGLGGGSEDTITSFNYQLSQEYTHHNFVGLSETSSTNPVTVWAGGEETVNIEAQQLTNPLLSGTPCPTIQEPISIVFNDCSGTLLGSVSVEGYSDSREWDTSADSIGTNAVSLRRLL